MDCTTTNEIYKYIHIWPDLSLEESLLCLSYRVTDRVIRAKAVRSLYSISDEEICLYGPFSIP